jgi:hypothetical protein
LASGLGPGLAAAFDDFVSITSWSTRCKLLPHRCYGDKIIKCCCQTRP